MSTLYIKRNDHNRDVTDTLTKDGVAIDVTGATVLFKMRNRETGVPMSKAGSVVSGPAGTVKVTLTTTETATCGVFDVEWEVTFAAGGVLSVPDNGFHTLEIVEDL
jgi:hypothetical protein